MKKEKKSSNPNAPSVLICDCSSTEHQIVIFPDSEDEMVYMHVHLTKHGFIRRLKVAIKYIFGYKSKYGAWDEFIFKPEHADKLYEIANLISESKYKPQL